MAEKNVFLVKGQTSIDLFFENYFPGFIKGEPGVRQPYQSSSLINVPSSDFLIKKWPTAFPISNGTEVRFEILDKTRETAKTVKVTKMFDVVEHDSICLKLKFVDEILRPIQENEF